MYTERFISYLEKEKKMARNSQEAYKRDVLEFIDFERSRGLDNGLETSSTEIVAYLHNLKSTGKSSATVNRKLASVRAFFNYLAGEGLVQENPTMGIKSPRIERKEIEYLSLEEIDILLETPDNSLKGRRDKAILEVLYATGIKVSESQFFWGATFEQYRGY